ncbi:MAG: type I-E CRISPR-associated endoribonuclease Cas2 [Clostridiales bacterium]|nr:type I-E CRISPR-associated endoribonuclease Cas2 [Clostridiales bacterium]
MMVLVCDGLKPGNRGELTKWLLEAKPGVFVGQVSALVRDLLWEKVSSDFEASAVLIFSSDSEQGFSMRMCGSPYRSVVDIEGISLIKTTCDEAKSLMNQ